MGEERGLYMASAAGGNPAASTRRSLVGTMIASLLAGVLTVLVVLTALPSSAGPQVAQAAGFGFCGDVIGLNMEAQGGKEPWYQVAHPYPVSGKGNRDLSMQDALGNGLAFVNYYGDGEGDSTATVKDDETWKEKTKTDASRLQAQRQGLNNCVIQSLGVGLANTILDAANGISGITQYVVLHSFDADLICTDQKRTGDCINLLKIIGGRGNETPSQVLNGQGGGVIGALTGNLYFPLMSLAVVLGGMWLAYTGLVRRRLREALFGALWVVLSAVIGLALLLNPALLTKAPLVAVNTATTCVVGAFNGENCMSGTSTSGSFATGSDAICKMDVAGASSSEEMELVAGNLTCKIWKAFILDMFAQGSFGTSFRNLDTVSTDAPTGALLTKAGLDPKAYCVSLHTSQSVDAQSGGTLSTSGGTTVCNILAYQMALRVDISSEGEKPDTAGGGVEDYRWYKVVDAAAADPGFWSNWTNGDPVGYAAIALICSVLGGIVLLVTSVFANVYYISSIIIMAFAPVFLLIGIHPGRGRRIMLGWVSKTVGNGLKYVASAAFLVVTISIYGGILEDIDSPAMTLMFVILVTTALLMYRKELVGLLGRADMGGEQVSSRMADILSSKGKGISGAAGRMAYVGAMGAVGAKIAGGTAGSGFADATKRQLRRQGGGLGAVAQQVERQSVANAHKVRAKASEAAEERNAAAADAQAANENADSIREQLEDASQRYVGFGDDARHRLAQMQAFDSAEEQAAKDMVSLSLADLKDVEADKDADPEKVKDVRLLHEQVVRFANFEQLMAQAGSLREEAAQVRRSDPRLAAAMEKKATRLERYARGIEANFDDVGGRTFSDLREARDERAETIRRDIGDFTDKEREDLRGFKAVHDEVNNLNEAYNASVLAAEQAHARKYDADLRYDAYRSNADRIAAQPGRTVTARTLKKVDTEVAQTRVKAGIVSEQTAKADLAAELALNKGRLPRASHDKDDILHSGKVYGAEDTEYDGSRRYDRYGEQATSATVRDRKMVSRGLPTVNPVLERRQGRHADGVEGGVSEVLSSAPAEEWKTPPPTLTLPTPKPQEPKQAAAADAQPSQPQAAQQEKNTWGADREAAPESAPADKPSSRAAEPRPTRRKPAPQGGALAGAGKPAPVEAEPAPDLQQPQPPKEETQPAPARQQAPRGQTSSQHRRPHRSVPAASPAPVAPVAPSEPDRQQDTPIKAASEAPQVSRPQPKAAGSVRARNEAPAPRPQPGPETLEATPVEVPERATTWEASLPTTPPPRRGVLNRLRRGSKPQRDNNLP